MGWWFLGVKLQRSPELKGGGSWAGGNALPVGKGREPLRLGVSPRGQSSAQGAGGGAKAPGPRRRPSRLSAQSAGSAGRQAGLARTAPAPRSRPGQALLGAPRAGEAYLTGSGDAQGRDILQEKVCFRTETASEALGWVDMRRAAAAWGWGRGGA